LSFRASEQNPIRFAANFRTPILLSVGENDFRVPLNQTLEKLERAATPAHSQQADCLALRKPLDPERRKPTASGIR
jgi:hypothetical protein